MSGSSLLIDTNIVLYLLAGDETVAHFLLEKQLYVSIITELELLGHKGITQKEQKAVESFLEELTIINIDPVIRQRVIALRKATGLKLPDCIIAATAFAFDLPLMSGDKQFKSIAELNLVFYEK